MKLALMCGLWILLLAGSAIIAALTAAFSGDSGTPETQRAAQRAVMAALWVAGGAAVVGLPLLVLSTSWRGVLVAYLLAFTPAAAAIIAVAASLPRK